MEITREKLEERVVDVYRDKGYLEPEGKTLSRFTNVNTYKKRLDNADFILKGNESVTIDIPRSLEDITYKFECSLGDLMCRNEIRPEYTNVTQWFRIIIKNCHWRYKVLESIENSIKSNLKLTDGHLTYKGMKVVKGITKDIDSIIDDAFDFLKNHYIQRRANTYQQYLINSKHKECVTSELDVYPRYKEVYNAFGEAPMKIDRLTDYSGYIQPTKPSDIFTWRSPSENIKKAFGSLVIELIAKINFSVTEKVTISAKPEDFILCSENTTGWRSCFAIDGEYHASTNAFYTDPRFLVSFTVDSSGKKVGRRWLWVDNDNFIICSGLEYGSYSSIKSVRMHLQKLMLEAKGIEYKPSDWKAIYGDSRGVDGCYCDSDYRVSFHKPHHSSSDYPDGFSDIYRDLPEGLSFDGYETDGHWETDRISCSCCGERIHYDISYYVYGEGDFCESCMESETFYCEHNQERYLNNLYGAHVEGLGDVCMASLHCYTYLEDTETYTSDDDYIYLEDIEVYVSLDYDPKYSEKLEGYVSHDYDWEAEEDCEGKPKVTEVVKVEVKEEASVTKETDVFAKSILEYVSAWEGLGRRREYFFGEAVRVQPPYGIVSVPLMLD